MESEHWNMKDSNKQKWYKFDLPESMIKYVVFILFLVLKFFTLDNCFFWDNIAGYSMPASYLLENGFQSFIYPAQYVAEPPLAHFYLALLWFLFGKSLLIAHLSITVFSLGVIWQVYNLCKRLNTKYTFYIFLLVLLEPALSTQMILISPDVIMCFFALLSTNLILDNHRKWLAVSALCLSLVSIRGFVICSGLGLGYLLIEIILHKKSLKNSLLYVFPAFIPALLAIVGWFIFRKIETGYFMYQPGFAYEEHRQLASLMQIVKNIAGLALSMLDSGRIIVWILLFASMIQLGIKKFYLSLSQSPLFLIYLSVLFTMALVTIPVTNPFGDRYFLYLYILLTLITCNFLVKAYKTKHVRILFVGMICVLFSGNFWVYSEKKSKAWDSVLCHLTYYSLRQDMIDYLENEHIDISSVTASFPMTALFANTDITDDNRQFSSAEIENSRYVLYSNLFNWDDERIDIIHTQWKIQKELKSGLIFLRLYVPKEKGE